MHKQRNNEWAYFFTVANFTNYNSNERYNAKGYLYACAYMAEDRN